MESGELKLKWIERARSVDQKRNFWKENQLSALFADKSWYFFSSFALISAAPALCEETDGGDDECGRDKWAPYQPFHRRMAWNMSSATKR